MFIIGEKPAAMQHPNKSTTSSSSSSTGSINMSSYSTDIFRNTFCILVLLVYLKEMVRKIS